MALVNPRLEGYPEGKSRGKFWRFYPRLIYITSDTS